MAGYQTMHIVSFKRHNVMQQSVYRARYNRMRCVNCAMPTDVPDAEELSALVGERLYSVWTDLRTMIEDNYDMEYIWNSGGKMWKYECKYSQGGKTLCALYARDGCIGFMIIFGKSERDIVDNNRHNYSDEVLKVYDASKTYHDGKWVMFMPDDISMFDDFMKMLRIKRNPNKK